jgi:PilZ domain-containing protein
VALVRALSLYGCLVKTEMPVKQDGKVTLRIARSGSQFSATGRVVNCVGTHSNRGLGIEFTASGQMLQFNEIEPTFTRLLANQLEKWWAWGESNSRHAV